MVGTVVMGGGLREFVGYNQTGVGEHQMSSCGQIDIQPSIMKPQDSGVWIILIISFHACWFD